MTRPATSQQRYDIVVRGRLSKRYESAFDGVTLEPRPGNTRLRADLAAWKHPARYRYSKRASGRDGATTVVAMVRR